MRRFVVLLGLVCLATATHARVPGLLSADEFLHEMMTKDELLEVFRAEPHAVPEYEVIPVHFAKGSDTQAPESATQLHINAFGRNIKLWLKPTEGILAGEDTPVYVIKSPTTGLKEGGAVNTTMDRDRGSMAKAGKLLEDIERQATIMVKKMDNGKEGVSGIVGMERLVVRPLPSRVNEHYSRQRRSADEVDPEVIAEEPHYHVVYRLPDDDEVVVERLGGGNFERLLNRTRQEVQVPEVIYPQVLVFVDFATYKLHGQNVVALLEYLLPFWNGVDLRYRSLVSPKVRFNIAGLIIAQDATALPFVLLKRWKKSMWVDASLARFVSFLVNNEEVFLNSTYDLAVAMVPYELCNSNNNCGILGLSYPGSACSILRTSIVMDMGGFDGIDTAAHEIGHMIGSQHDGFDSDTGLDFGPGALCPPSDGYIMTPDAIKTKNQANWSNCSLTQFETFFRNMAQQIGDPTCLFDKPQTTKPLPRVMPGRLMTLDEQCQKIQGTNYNSSFNLQGDDICILLPCLGEGTPSNDTTVRVAPVDGTICGDNKVCINAKCIDQSLFI